VVGSLSKLVERLEQVQHHHGAKAKAAAERCIQARKEADSALAEADRAWRVRTNIKKLVEG
jgi:hypothetical protein